MDDDGDTVKVVPVPIKVPPQDAEYHFQLAPVPKLPPLRVKVVVPPEQIDDGLAEAPVGTVDGRFTVKLPELVPVPFGEVTLTVPVVAVAGTVTVIAELLFTNVWVAATPLISTAVAPVK